ncbi:MAG: DNA polymerase III subunit gamma/tau [Gammaproteobacteria bacterium]
MSYEVLARKWRPRSFSTMVGQEHVVRALVNALDNDRVHHAFLFTGTRGVGKTTVARIFAKALNCLEGVGSDPCGVCAACTSIDEGRFVDLIEVDAASRTKVEDTRELLENVQYAPTSGRYKVYLVDEVHMLSTHSFNALLKTLEEPPPHVKFLLATTDPQKLPITVLSRCLQFNLKRLPADLIGGYLEDILGKEGIDFEAPAVRTLSRSADGSMRDALSLLDQAIAFGAGAVKTAEVDAMLGSIDRQHVMRILEALVANDGAALLKAVEKLVEDAPDFSEVLADLLTALQRIAILQTVPDAGTNDWEDHAELSELASRMSPEDCQLFYQIALNGRRDLPFAPEPRGGLEMVLLRMLAFRPAETTAASPVPSATAPRAATSGAPTMPAATASSAATTASPVAQAKASPEAEPTAAVSPSSDPPVVGNDWQSIFSRLKVGGMTRELAANCQWLGREGDVITLAIPPQHGQLRSESIEGRLTDAVSEALGEKVKLRFEETQPTGETPAALRQRQQDERQQRAEDSIANDPNVQAMVETFDARVVPDSVQPID